MMAFSTNGFKQDVIQLAPRISNDVQVCIFEGQEVRLSNAQPLEPLGSAGVVTIAKECSL